MRIAILGPGDESVLDAVAAEVFDNPTKQASVGEFLADPRHHLAVAIDGDQVVGFASGVHYVHPDKPAELWINEVGVAPTHQKRGLAKALLGAVLDVGKQLGCREAWVLTHADNVPARALYKGSGGVEAPGDVKMYEFALSDDRDSSTPVQNVDE